jgi:hypothetical protein
MPAPASPQAVFGVAITAKVGGLCTASVGGVPTTIRVARDQTVAAGDGLIVQKTGPVWTVVGRTGTTTPVPPSEPPDPIPSQFAGATGELICPAVTTRTYRGGKWRFENQDLLQGERGSTGNNVGAAFYGYRALSLEGTTVTSASIKVRRLPTGPNAPQTTTLWLVTERFRPAGAPTRTSSTTGPSLRVGRTNEAFAVPTSWAQQMVDGTAGGLALYSASGSPYVKFAGRGSWSAAFTLTINWRRF